MLGLSVDTVIRFREHRLAKLQVNELPASDQIAQGNSDLHNEPPQTRSVPEIGADLMQLVDKSLQGLENSSPIFLVGTGFKFDGRQILDL